MGWNEYAHLNSLAVCVNPGSAFNCYWPMPFRKRARMTLTNISEEAILVYYQIDYALCAVEEDEAYFHAQFRRVNPLPYKEVYTILDGVKGRGKYVGTYMARSVNNRGWWGEGEIKFYMDGDTEYPTICGTGTEDYFCGSYSSEDPDAPPEITECSPRRMPVCIRSLRRTSISTASSGSECIAGTLPIRSILKRRSKSRCRRWAGVKAAVICPCRTILLRWPSGIRRFPPMLSRLFRTRIRWK